LYADGLACAMLWMSAVVGAAVSVYSLEYFASPDDDADEQRGRHTQFWPQWLLLWCALHALFLSRDVFNLYVTLELLTLTAVGLVAVAGTRAAVEAALRYLLAAVAGSLLFLMGVALVYGAHGALDIESLAVGQAASLPVSSVPTIRRLEAYPTLFGALVLMVLGLMLKTALFPFHFWLPPAHSSAPAPVSALLSALVVKGSFYILLRLWFDLFPAAVTQPVAMLPAMLGAAAIAWGSVQALVAERLKLLVAYSTVAQLGYLFLVFALARPASGYDAGSGQAVWSACVLFALSHALAKAALFLAAGTILHVVGHDRLRDLSGASRRMPVTFFAIGCASVTLMGLPPTGAFVAKWTMLKAALAGGYVALAIVIVGGGLLAAAYLFPVLAAAFAAPGDEDAAGHHASAPRVLEYSTLALALASLLLGLAASPVIQLIEIGSPWPQFVVERAAP
jgi:formate hydrogenlyase subunit 3/multisubunit Na+/H+ antiporter MnhD subunit